MDNLIEFPVRDNWMREALTEMVRDIHLVSCLGTTQEMKLLAEAGEPEPEDAA